MSEVETLPPTAAAPAGPRPNEANKNWMAGLGQVSDGAGGVVGRPSPEQPKDESPEPEPKEEAPPQPVAKAAAEASPEGADVAKAVADEAPKESADKWPRSAQEWKKFREARDKAFAERDARIQEMETELGSLRTKSTVDPNEFESVKQERDALSERLRVVSVEKHPKFERYFNQKTEAQFEMAKRLVGPEKSETVLALLKQDDTPERTQKLEEALADLPSLKQLQFGGVLNNLDAIRAERASEIAKAAQTYEEMVASEQKSGQDRRQHLEKTFEGSVSKLTGKEGSALFQPRENDPAWNNEVKSRIDAAKAILFSNQQPETLVEAALNAVAYKPLLKALKYSIDESAKLKAQIAELTKANPGLQGTNNPAPGGEPQGRKDIPSGARPMDVARSFMQGLPAVK